MKAKQNVTEQKNITMGKENSILVRVVGNQAT